MEDLIQVFKEKGKLVRSGERYKIYDIDIGKRILSMTILHKGKETSGHSHEDAEELYLFINGEGKIQIGNENKNVKKGNIIFIPKGDFHKVFNLGDNDLIFIAFFPKYSGYETRGKN